MTTDERNHVGRHGRPGAPGVSLSQRLLQYLAASGLAYGREDAFKMGPGRLLADRLLVGLPGSSVDAAAARALAVAFGMPAAAWDLIVPNIAQANAVFLGTEEGAGVQVCKLYLEFWDVVRQRVRDGARDPQLLHFGVKWGSARPGHFEQARYLCHPLLGARDVLRRMADAYAGVDGACTLDPARSIVRQGYRRVPQAGFLYLEASEVDNPRRSFDINLYKSGLLVREVAGELREIAARLSIAPSELETQIERLGACPLGHISGGRDRRGQEFLSVYAEIQPLPDA